MHKDMKFISPLCRGIRIRSMKKKHYIRISPDYNVLYVDSEGCCYSAFGDEICNEEPDLQPHFRFVIPGIEEWIRRYELATDFAATTTDPTFNWKSWHYEGLCFAKAIWEQLPRCYSLYYEPPFEDKSAIIGHIEFDAQIDTLIQQFHKDVCHKVLVPSFTDNIEFKIKRCAEQLKILFRINRMKAEVSIPFTRLSGVRNWLKCIIEGNEPVITLQFPNWDLHFFRQTIGSHLEMGQFWVMKSSGREILFQAYVNTKEFVKGMYLSLMTKLGFYLYDNIDAYPSGEERLSIWTPYNNLKSRSIELFIINHAPLFDNEHKTFVNETFVMFPEYGGTIFWDTMGVGSGDYNELYSDSGAIKIDVPGLKKWSEFYDNHDNSQTFDEYWHEGWELAQKVRQQLPDNIDLYYMCFDPKQPHTIVSYNCMLPRILVFK